MSLRLQNTTARRPDPLLVPGFVPGEKIELVDLQRQYRTIQPEIDAAIHSIVSAGSFVGGKPVERFESEFAAYCGAAETVSVASGTDALYLALCAFGVGPGDEVITVPHTFIATVSAILQTGASVVFTDIDPETYCLDPATLAARITSRTKAIIPVHIYGHPADMDPIMEIAEQHGLFVLEDACQAHGASYKGRRVGGLGHAAAFSFYPSKNLGAFGDGGAITTRDPKLAATLRGLRDHGRTSKYEHCRFAYNSRLDALQAAVLSVKLRYLDQWNAQRRSAAAQYAALLQGTPGLTLPTEAAYAKSVWHLYPVRTVQREHLQAALDQASVGHGIHYPIPIHLQPAWEAEFGKGLYRSFPRIERYARELLSLPMHPHLAAGEVEYVARVVGDAVKLRDFAVPPVYGTHRSVSVSASAVSAAA